MKNLLIVDDEKEIRECLASILEDIGFKVTTATDGLDAFNKVLAHGNFDLILTDYKMPRMDGLTLAKHIKNNFPKTPILLMSAIFSLENNKCNDFDCVVTKPFDLETIENKIKELLVENVLT